MYNLKHRRIGNPLKYRGTQSAEPIGERASSKLKVSATTALYAATKPKARSTNGFFAFCLTRQGAIANGLHGLNPINTALISPVSKRRPALIERLVKQMGHGETTHLYKRINPSRALGALLFIYKSGEG
jgi:hypothetical protein